MSLLASRRVVGVPARQLLCDDVDDDVERPVVRAELQVRFRLQVASATRSDSSRCARPTRCRDRPRRPPALPRSPPDLRIGSSPRSRAPCSISRATRGRARRARPATRPPAAARPSPGRARRAFRLGEGRPSPIGRRAVTTGNSNAMRLVPAVARRGGGQMFGQSAPASARRMRWPGSNTHDVASSSTRDLACDPGFERLGARPTTPMGQVEQARVTSADVPSGKHVAELRRKERDRNRRS